MLGRTYALGYEPDLADAVAAGHTTPEAIVQHVYADVDRSLWPAAERSTFSSRSGRTVSLAGRRPTDS